MHFALPALLEIPKLAVSDYKGVSYARKFPDSRRVYEGVSPFGYLEVYSSSYLHFAPGLSDNAAFNLPSMPVNAYLGMYIDGDGPSGIIRNLPAEQTSYYRFLPMFYPYLLKQAPDTFVVQFGGGISTSVALRSNSQRVTVAEGNPAVRHAFRTDEGLRAFTGDVLNDPKVRVIDYDGRLYLAYTADRYDIIDLSLANSAGLSSPGGFAIVEKFSYTQEAMQSYMRALKPGGILSVTLWNKEDPPKSVLKLYATLVAAARQIDAAELANRFFVSASYLSTVTVLYKRGGFSAGEIAMLREHTHAMSFDEIYAPDLEYDPTLTATVLEDYRQQVFAAPDKNEDATAATNPDETGENPQSPPARHEERTRILRIDRSGHRHGTVGVAPPRARRLGGYRASLCLRHAPAHQRPAVLRRLCQTRRSAAHHRPVGAVPGRVGVSAALDHAGHRMPDRDVAGAPSGHLRLAHDL